MVRLITAFTHKDEWLLSVKENEYVVVLRQGEVQNHINAEFGNSS